jgi:hypothetical protein
MWGPVVIDGDSMWFCGATRGTNNTGEITDIGQAVMWRLCRSIAATPPTW